MVVGEKMTMFTDNQGIMTYYEVQHLNPKEEVVYDENLRLEKLAEEEGDHKREKDLRGFVSQLLQPTVEEHVEQEAEETEIKP